MTAGMYIVAICALGGAIACFGFIWAIRSGDLANVEEAKWLVFDDEDELEPGLVRPPVRPPVPPSPRSIS